MSNMTTEMKRFKISRLVYLSADPTMNNWECGEEMKSDLVKASRIITERKELKWTVILAPKILNQPKSRKYRTSNDSLPKGAIEIGGGDLGHYCYVSLHDPLTHNKCMGCAI